MGNVDRRPYESAIVLNQDILDESHDNLTMKLEMIAELEGPSETLYLSDEAKYVGNTFYYPRVVFPIVNRTVGDWLAGELEFSSISITINNADKKYSDVLPGGSGYDGWIGRRLTVKIGLGEIASTYTTLFTGPVTDVSGFSRNTTTFTVQARSDFESANVQIPDQLLIPDDFTDIEDDFVGLGAPIIYGDWTINLRPQAPEIPAFPVNGANAGVIAGTSDLRLVISSTPLKSVDTTSFVLFRGDQYLSIPSGDVSIVPFTDNQIVDIAQQGFFVDPPDNTTLWIYEAGDQFFLKCQGIDLAGLDNNIVTQSKDILTRFTSLTAGDFDATWTTFQNKTAPSQSAVFNIDSRVWIQESVNAVEQVASMLEQVRLEPFISRDNLFSLTALHFDEFQSSPSFSVKNWDVILGSFQPQTDERNNWNRAKADYRFTPTTGENSFSTALYKNTAAINQAGRAISKLVAFPNITQGTDVVNQLGEMLRLASAYAEMIEVTLTPRAFLLDIGDFIHLDVNIGTVEFGFTSVVGIIREISYDPEGRAIKLKIWSLQMINFPGYTGPAGTVGGYDAVVTKET